MMKQSMEPVRKRAICLAGALLAAMACCISAAGQAATSPQNAALMAQLREAVLAAKHGDPTGALAQADRLIEEHPKFAPAMKFKAALLEDMGHAPEAALAYEEALKLAPNDPELLFKVGVYELIGGDKDEAIRLLVRELKITPKDGDALFYLAQAYHLKGDDARALTMIKGCVRAEPENASVWQKYGELLCSSGDNVEGMRWLLKAQQSDPTLDRLDFDLAVASYNSMDLNNAAVYAGRAVEKQPNDITALEMLAQTDVKLANWQDGGDAFRRILALKSDDASAQLGLGHCELELKDYQPAATLLEAVLQQDPTLVLAHFYLSRAYAGLGRAADAQHEAELHSKMLEQANSRTPSDDSESEKEAMLEARKLLSDNQEAKALAIFKQQAKGSSATPGGPYMLVGALYLYMGQPEDATRCLDKALAIEPAIHEAHTYLGMMALQRNELDKAESEFKAELAGRQNSPLAVAELGEVRYRQGRWSDAVDQLTRSRTTTPTLLYMLCDSYFHLGKVKEADLTAELLVDYGKNDQDVEQSVIELLHRNQQTELAQKLAGKISS